MIGSVRFVNRKWKYFSDVYLPSEHNSICNLMVEKHNQAHEEKILCDCPDHGLVQVSGFHDGLANLMLSATESLSDLHPCDSANQS